MSRTGAVALALTALGAAAGRQRRVAVLRLLVPRLSAVAGLRLIAAGLAMVAGIAALVIAILLVRGALL